VYQKFVSEIPASHAVFQQLGVTRPIRELAAPVPVPRIGYTRVSTVSQTLEQQNVALKGAGATKTFSDAMSGARDDRPGLTALIDYVRSLRTTPKRASYCW
jgi:hypothetical protein